MVYDVIIIGSGPAGLTAALYTSRANLKTLVIAGIKWGGQLQLTSEVENYPGFPEGIQGPELMQRFRKQAEKFGTQIIDVNFEKGDFAKKPFTIVAGPKTYQSKAVIIASGADTKWLGIPGEERLIGKGISSCAPCDAFFFRNKKVVVVGGGDSAMEEALFLTKFATEIIIIHRRDHLRASEIMQQKAFENPKIKFIWNTVPVEVLGETKVEGIKLESRSMNDESRVKVKIENKERRVGVEEVDGKILQQKVGALVWERPVDGIFVAIGHIPNSQLFPGIDTDEKGFIKKYTKAGEGVWQYKMMTNVDGVFVAGDVYDKQYKQAVTAAGLGCMAAMEVEKWLESFGC